jgi:hypothetical protein
VRNTLKARRFYATFDHNLRLSYTAEGHWMGSRLEREAGQTVTLLVQAEDPDAGDQIRRIEIYGSDTPEPTCDFHQFDEAGDRQIVLKAMPLAASDFDSESASFEVSVVPSPGRESWYFAKVIEVDGEVAYTSPIWVTVP